MVRDGYIYGFSFLAVAAALAWLTGVWVWGIAPVLLAAFFLWFFRDPQRTIPAGEGLIVSPGDGLVTETASIATPEGPRQRISIFLSVFDVHVNRAPIGGVAEPRALSEGPVSQRHEPGLGRAQRAKRCHRSRPGCGRGVRSHLQADCRACWRGASSSAALKARPWSAGSAWASSNSAPGSMLCCRPTPSCASRWESGSRAAPACWPLSCSGRPRMNHFDPARDQAETAAPPAPRHVPAAFAVYRRQHRRRLLLHHADHRGHQRRRAAAPGLGGHRHPFRHSFRRARRAHCAHDQHRQRFRQGTGFAGRR